MIFAFILSIIFIAIFIKLGMYSVWFTVLYIGLKLALMVIVGLILLLTGLFIPVIWRRFFGKNRKLIN